MKKVSNQDLAILLNELPEKIEVVKQRCAVGYDDGDMVAALHNLYVRLDAEWVSRYGKSYSAFDNPGLVSAN
jgi:hypothetical protein